MVAALLEAKANPNVRDERAACPRRWPPITISPRSSGLGGEQSEIPNVFVAATVGATTGSQPCQGGLLHGQTSKPRRPDAVARCGARRHLMRSRLADLKADPKPLTNQGQYASSYVDAAARGRHCRPSANCEVLLDRGADVNAAMHAANSRRCTMPHGTEMPR